MNSYKKLAMNSAVFAIGNMGSKLISFILVPLYTYYLTTEEYGVADLIITTTSLLLPIVSANIFDSVLRFVMDKDESKEKVITNAIIISMIGVLALLLIYPIISFFIAKNSLINFVYIILILQVYQTILGQFTRATGEIRLFAINGVVMTIVTGLSNVILLTVFHLGIDGYLISIIIANLISVVFLGLKVKIWTQIDFTLLDRTLISRMLIYCIPIIPNSIMWWLINASNRYFILFFIGANANGIYAVANKIPSLLSLLSTIFYQAWQLSAIEEYQSEDKSSFYSKVFGLYSTVLLFGTSIIIIFSRFIMLNFMSVEYQDGWKIIPFLLIGVIFSSLSNFLGANYLAAKKTKGVFKTSLYGGLMSLLLNAILVPLIGILGSAIATMISFGLMCILRIVDTRKFVILKIDFKLVILNFSFIALQIINLFIVSDLLVQVSIGIVIFFIQLLSNKDIMKILHKLIIKSIQMIKKKKL